MSDFFANIIKVVWSESIEFLYFSALCFKKIYCKLLYYIEDLFVKRNLFIMGAIIAYGTIGSKLVVKKLTDHERDIT